MMNERRETRLIVLATRPVSSPVEIAQLHAALDEEIDWSAVVEIAMRHGVTAQVFERLREVAEEEIPPEIADAARTFIERLKARNREFIDELFAILDAFERASIDVIPFKGPLLASLVYRDATVRACRDLDFLVHRGAMVRAISVLRTLGYQGQADLTPQQEAACIGLAGQAEFFRTGGAAAVEPHWAFAPSNLGLAIDYEGLWQRSQAVIFEGRRVRTFAPEDLVIALCIHGGKDEWTKLKTICDLARAVMTFTKLDWRVVVARAEQQRCLRMLLIGILLANRLMGVEFPNEVSTASARTPGALALTKIARARLFADRADGGSIFYVSHFRFWQHDRWLDRLRYVALTMATPRTVHFTMVKLPDQLFFCYYPIKLLHDYLLLPIWLLAKRISRLGAAPAQR